MTSTQALSDPSLVLLAEMTHRVANEYALAISGLSLAASKATSSDVRAGLQSAAARLGYFASAHRALQAPSSATPVDLGAYLEGLCRALLQAGLQERGISLTLLAESLVIEPSRCWRIGLIVAELITNARRHAFAGAGGEITVELAVSDRHATCSVADHGPRAGEWRSGAGTRIVEALAREMGGCVQWTRSPCGTTATLAFMTDH